MTDELEQGTATVDDEDTWHLTASGRELALAVQRAIGVRAISAHRRRTPARAGGTSGGSRGSPPGLALCLTTRLGALRHHRADAHRTAWQAAGCGVDEIRAMPDGPERRAIEDATNRLDEPIYASLSAGERLELLAGLGALPG